MKRQKPFSRIVFGGASALAITLSAPALAQEATPETTPPAAAQPASSESDLKLGSITVTATRREESAQDVPMAIQAFSEDTLNQLNINSVEDLTTVVPGFSVSQSYQGVPTYTLRGIGFNTINLSATSTVGTYVDEVAYPYPFMNSGPVFDVSRVEVLKGPQGTLFGRNTTAGLINVVTNKPVDEFQAMAKAEVGNYDTWNLEGMVNLPISETVQARFAIRSENSDKGWQRSMSRPDEDRGTVDKLGFRAALALQPTDKLDVNLSYNGWINKSDTIAAQGIGLTPSTNPTFTVPGTSGPSATSGFNAPGLIAFLQNNRPSSAKDADWVPYNVRAATIAGVPGMTDDNKEDSTFHAFRAGINYTFDNDLTLVSLTGYNKLEREAILDFSGAPYQILNQDIDGEIKSFSQELRLEGQTDRINWLVGAYYGKDETLDTNRTMLRDNANSNFISTAAYLLTVNPAALGFDPVTVGPLVAFVNRDPETGLPYTAAELLNSFQTYRDSGDFETTTQSIFANIDWEISPEFSLTTGLRYTEDKQNYVGCSADVNGSMQPNVNVFNRVFFTGIYGLAAPPAALQENGCNTYDVASNSFGPVTSSTKEDNVSWRIVGNWTPRDNMLLFASVTQGYKSASTPVNAASKSEQNAPATQEGLLAYEVGMKAQFFNQRLQANSSFFYDYEDKQVASFFPDPIYRALSRLQNVPKSEAYGFETELTWLINENLTAMGGLTLLQTEIKEFDTSDSFGLPTSRAGDPFLYSPETSLSLALLYNRPVTDRYGVRGSLSGRWQSESTAGDPDDPLYDIDSYGVLNGSIGLYTLNDTWEFSIWGQNLTDEYYTQQVTTNANVVVRYGSKPRTYGAALTYRF